MHDHDHQDHDHSAAHHHDCGNLFGCGDEKGTGVIREDLKDAAFDHRAADRLLHMDEMDQERLDGYLGTRGNERRHLLRASSFMGALAAVGPWFAKLAHAADAAQPLPKRGGGRIHTVDSNKQTVQLGVFDATLPPILTIESGEAVSYHQHLVAFPERDAARRADRPAGRDAQGQPRQGTAFDHRADRGQGRRAR